MLLVPAILQRIVIGYRFPNLWGWERQAIQFILSLYKASAGALIMCSMVVFCRKVLELEESKWGLGGTFRQDRLQSKSEIRNTRPAGNNRV